MALLPANFSWLRPSVLDLESGTGQTESRTDDGHRRFMPPPRREHSNRFSLP